MRKVSTELHSLRSLLDVKNEENDFLKKQIQDLKTEVKALKEEKASNHLNTLNSNFDHTKGMSYDDTLITKFQRTPISAAF